MDSIVQRTMYVVKGDSGPDTKRSTVNPSSSPNRSPLDRTTIVAAGVALADEDGVDSLTMRRLAEHVGFKAMALYNHVADKDELLALMVDAVASEVDEPDPGVPPLAAVRAHAVDTRAAFVRHPWAPELWQRSLPGPGRRDHMEALLRTFDASDLSPEVAHLGYHAVTNHVLGYTLQELAMDLGVSDPDAKAKAEEFMASMSVETHPHTIAHVHQHLAGESTSSFEIVLDLILDGLVRLRADD